MERRVVITGIGALTPIGNNTAEFWDGLKNGKNGIAHITKFDTEAVQSKAVCAGELKNFDPTTVVEKKETKRLDMFSIYGMAVADEAVKMSGIDLESIDKHKFGVVFGSGIGGLTTIEEQGRRLVEKGINKIAPLFIPMAISNMAAGNIGFLYCITYGLGRFAIEFLRNDYRGEVGIFSTSQFISLFIVLLGVVAMAVNHKLKNADR